MGIKNTLDTIVNVTKQIEELKLKRADVDAEIKDLEAIITGRGDVHDPELVVQLNKTIDKSETFWSAVKNDLIVHQGYKISIPSEGDYIDGLVVAQKIYTLDGDQND